MAAAAQFPDAAEILLPGAVRASAHHGRRYRRCRAPYRDLNELPDDAAAAEAARSLRKMLQKASGPQELRLFSTLWAVEFRVRPAAEQQEEREQVAQDLKRLMPLAADPRIRSAIQSAATFGLGQKKDVFCLE